VETADGDPATPGIQVRTSGGVIAFEVRASTHSGPGLMTATSVQGGAYGELSYVFLPGPPAPPVTWAVGKPEGPGPVNVTMTSGVVRDEFGNPVRDGLMLTVVVEGATLTSGDADLGQPGHQALTGNSRIATDIEVPSPDAQFTLATYADSELTRLLGQGTYSPSDYVPMPVRGAVALSIIMLVARLALGRKTAIGE